MTIKEKQELLLIAAKRLKDEFTEDNLFALIHISFGVLRPDNGLIWAEVKEVVSEVVKQ